MVALYKDPKGENIFKKSGNTEAATFVPKSMGGEGGEADNNDMETLKKRIKDLESELEKAKVRKEEESYNFPCTSGWQAELFPTSENNSECS